MDRNIILQEYTFVNNVALRKESVDRNPCLAWQFTERWPSLSARRAWIEIYKHRIHHKEKKVALRKESVDRNMLFWLFRPVVGLSLSARRAWIEIKYVVKDSDFSGCRSPQGERG